MTPSGAEQTGFVSVPGDLVLSSIHLEKVSYSNSHRAPSSHHALLPRAVFTYGDASLDFSDRRCIGSSWPCEQSGLCSFSSSNVPSSSTWRSEWGECFLPYFSLLECEVEVLSTFLHYGNVECLLTSILTSSYNYLAVFLPSFYKSVRNWKQ